ncbi:MAG: DUF4190 domain-containing protein [Streptosporangiaceae bacterium]|nr:DUF4190 domain-containing protein [Streptosporangiaceae bacterium]
MSRLQTGTRAEPAYTQYQPRRTNRMAIWSLVLSIITLGGLGSIAGIWLGARARSRIRQTGEDGDGLALAGIIIGVITLLFAIGYWVFVAKYVGGHHGGGGTGGGY